MINKTHFWSDKECYSALYIIYLFSVNYGKVWQKRIKSFNEHFSQHIHLQSVLMGSSRCWINMRSVITSHLCRDHLLRGFHIIFSVDLMIANDISANKSICYCTLKSFWVKCPCSQESCWWRSLSLCVCVCVCVAAEA